MGSLLTGILIYLFLINLAAFAEMGIDKRRAKRGEWRIPEKTLFFTAAAGGSAGSLIGMRVFRHKTKKKKFTAGMPAIFSVHIAVLILALYHFSVF